MAKENIIKTDLICEVQKKHINHKTEERKANELAELKEELKERNAEAKAYSRKVFLKKIFKIALVTLGTIGFIAAIGITSEFDLAEAKSRETRPTMETTTEQTTEEQTTTEVTADFECIIREVVGDTITVEYNDNLYSFFGDGYKAGQKVICTFTDAMEIINASEPIISEETTTETKFYDVPLSEDLQLHIFSECEKYNLSPALVIAIIERESTYDPSRVGDNGKSLGIMQVQPQWHSHRIDELGYSHTEFDWFNAKQNISIGCHYLAELYGKYGDDVYTVLMGYNGSPRYVRDMLNAGKISDYALEVSARAEELENE